uniref:Xylanase inhibitor C-terminal domain-containing protein n=1 Tax=Nelumbo nucifera TaxID=4432 RepID=A0A822YRB5_NELNU|nr:TPA_asm: hypothetical protein HUJ06_012436 [Nelumbo nucifera]
MTSSSDRSELVNGVKWTIFRSNSMKQVSVDVACLAFVDGGETADQAVVIGTFQMENNLLEFDLVTSTLVFSSSLFFVKSTCANFNFTLWKLINIIIISQGQAICLPVFSH